MKSKKEFLNAFFDRLTEMGFMVETADEVDIAAEVFHDNKLLFLITADGEIIYETYDDEKVRELEEVVKEMQGLLDVCTISPILQTDEAEKVWLTRGAYYKVMESTNTVLLCRYSGIFGYEFVTCNKTKGKLNDRKYYREQIHYSYEDAQMSFAERSNITLCQSSLYNDDELRLVLACLTRTMCLDNNIDSKMEQEVKELISKTEQYLPKQERFSPRNFYEREQN